MAGNNLKSYDDQINPEGVGRVGRSTDDSDVEGHVKGFKPKASDDQLAPEGVRKTRKTTDDDDVEGHGKKVR